MNARSELFGAFERAGFRLVRCNRHAIWACPCGHRLVTIPHTPRKGRHSDENSLALLKGTIAVCKQNLEARNT